MKNIKREITMQNRIFILIIIFYIIFSIINTGYCIELSGWIKGDMCWVVKTPEPDAKIIGIILQKAAVTVEDNGNDWLRIIFAPVRNIDTGKWMECSGCYIYRKNFTTVIPNKW